MAGEAEGSGYGERRRLHLHGRTESGELACGGYHELKHKMKVHCVGGSGNQIILS